MQLPVSRSLVVLLFLGWTFKRRFLVNGRPFASTASVLFHICVRSGLHRRWGVSGKDNKSNVSPPNSVLARRREARANLPGQNFPAAPVSPPLRWEGRGMLLLAQENLCLPGSPQGSLKHPLLWAVCKRCSSRCICPNTPLRSDTWQRAERPPRPQNVTLTSSQCDVVLGPFCLLNKGRVPSGGR